MIVILRKSSPLEFCFENSSNNTRKACGHDDWELFCHFIRKSSISIPEIPNRQVGLEVQELPFFQPFMDIPWKTYEPCCCCPQAFIHHLRFLITNPDFLRLIRYSFRITFSSFNGRSRVELAIPDYKYQLPGQAVISPKELYPFSPRPKFFWSSW